MMLTTWKRPKQTEIQPCSASSRLPVVLSYWGGIEDDSRQLEQNSSMGYVQLKKADSDCNHVTGAAGQDETTTVASFND